MLVWLDGRTNTRQRPQENFGREIMELFTLGVGNYTEQDVYAAARVFTGWNLRAGRARARRPARLLRVRLQRRTSTTRRPRRSRSRSTATAARTIPARAAERRHAGRHRLHQRRWPRIRTRPSAWRASCGTSSSARSMPPDPEFLRGAAGVYLRERHAHEAGRAVHAAVALVPESRQLALRATRGRWSSSCARSRKSGWTGFSVDAMRAPLDAHGADALRAAGRQRLGARAGLVLDRRDAGAHELRLDDRGEPAVQPGHRRGRRRRTRPRRSLEFFLDRLSPAPFDQAPLDYAQGVSRGRRARGPAPTRSCSRRPPGWPG